MEMRGGADTDALFLVDKRRGLGKFAFRTLFEEIKWFARIDRDIKPHALRHAYATRLYEHGVNLYGIQQLMGHSDISTTQKYLHGNAETLRIEAEKASLFAE